MAKQVSTAIEPAKLSPPAPAYFTRDQIELIKRQICPGASDDELKMFLRDCETSRLDPFARQIYSIERTEKYRDAQGNWKTRKKRVTQYSIDGFRLIAERTGEYAGQLGPEWCGADGVWHDVWLDPDMAPAAARVAALRKDFEKPMWTPALFNEYCPRFDGKPTGRWAIAPAGMLAKCAEALALRRAFPNELANRYTGDEMGSEPPRDVTPREEYDEALKADLDRDPIEHELDVVADDGGPPSAAAAPAAGDSAATAGALSVEDMAREAARRGPDQLRMFFNKRSSDEKKRLRKIEAELVALYPPLTQGGK